MTLKKFTASLIGAVLLLTTPGFGCWQAVAQVVTQTGAATTAVSGQAGAVGAAGVRNAGTLGMPSALTLGPSVLSPVTTVRSVVGAANQNAARPLSLGVGANRLATGGSNVAAQSIAIGGTVRPIAGAAQAAKSEGMADRLSAPVQKLLSDPKSISISAAEVGRMSGGQARDAADRQMDRVLGQTAADETGSVVAGVEVSSPKNVLRAAPTGGSDELVPSSYRAPASPNQPGSPAPNGAGSKIVRILTSLAFVGAGAAAATFVQAAAVALAPGIFGLIPGAAVWAVMSGVAIGPAALYFRYRMSLRDSERLKGPKRLFDVALGALGGAIYVALPGILTGAIMTNPAMAMTVGVIGLGSVLAMVGGESHLKSGLLALGSTALVSAVATGIGPMTIGAVFGLLAMPVLTTLSLYLGRIV
ncbi:MAG: hypothetical protein HY925_08990 [Elusimicrobia bacterium]|nr:hypothetical protein [Elusimicrobiota bacterium]